MHTYPSPPTLPAIVMNGQVSKEEAGAILRRRREALKMKQEQVIDEIGIPTITQLSEYENGKVSVARSKYFPALARVLKLSEDEVRAINPSAIFDAPRPEPNGLLTLDEQARNIAGRTPSQVIFISSSDLVTVPVRGLAAAGDAFYSEENIIGSVTLPQTDFNPAHHLIRVQGNSMSPTLTDGDHVAIDPQDVDLQDGRVYVFHVHGNGHCIKRCRRLADGHLYLTSDNAEYPPMKPEEVTVRGRAARHYPQGRDL